MAREAAAVVVAEDVEVAAVSAVTDAVEAMEEAAVAMAVENDEDTVVVAAVEVAVMEIEMEVAKVAAVDTVEAAEVVVMTVESVADMAVVVAAVAETPTLADKTIKSDSMRIWRLVILKPSTTWSPHQVECYSSSSTYFSSKLKKLIQIKFIKDLSHFSPNNLLLKSTS